MEFRRADSDADFEASPNVIPLVDIMLVLLIIFMITAPVLKHSFEVDLPRAESPVLTEQTEDIPIITISRDGKITVNGLYIRSTAELENVLAQLKKKEVAIEADKNVKYEVVIEVMDTIKKVGIERIGLVTQQK